MQNICFFVFAWCPPNSNTSSSKNICNISGSESSSLISRVLHLQQEAMSHPSIYFQKFILTCNLQFICSISFIFSIEGCIKLWTLDLDSHNNYVDFWRLYLKGIHNNSRYGLYLKMIKCVHCFLVFSLFIKSCMVDLDF